MELKRYAALHLLRIDSLSLPPINSQFLEMLDLFWELTAKKLQLVEERYVYGCLARLMKLAIKLAMSNYQVN